MKLNLTKNLTETQTFWAGIGLCILGIITAIWLGGWVFFIGGIVQLIESIKADPVSGWGILWGIIRIKLSLVAFWISLIPIFGTGVAFIQKGNS